jgi:heme A synthase
MRGVYRVLAGLVALEVAIQAAVMALAVFGLTAWVDGGATLDKAVMESDEFPFPEAVGFMIHGINGIMVIPLLALLLLVVSFFAKVPGGVTWAAVVLATVVVQVLLGIFAHEAPALGALHGLNALLIFGAAVMALMRARDRAVTTPSTTTTAAGTPTRV